MLLFLKFKKYKIQIQDAPANLILNQLQDWLSQKIDIDQLLLELSSGIYCFKIEYVPISLSRKFEQYFVYNMAFSPECQYLRAISCIFVSTVHFPCSFMLMDAIIYFIFFTLQLDKKPHSFPKPLFIFYFSVDRWHLID